MPIQTSKVLSRESLGFGEDAAHQLLRTLCETSEDGRHAQK